VWSPEDDEFLGGGGIVFFCYRTNYYKISSLNQALVAQACNPSCSGGSDQEDGGLKPVSRKSFMRLYLKKKKKKNHHKKELTERLKQ
jgi:hypothetical protein